MSSDNVSRRLGQAIVLNDLALVQRILNTNPFILYNSILNEKVDTSLHLAASLGFTDIARHLILLGHDSLSPYIDDICGAANVHHGTSINVDGQCPLHLAAANLHTPLVELLCESFPSTVNRKDKDGRTPLLLAAGALVRTATSVPKPTVRAAEDVSTIMTLLEHGADVSAKDFRGNTCLHNACAFGNLKAIRALMEAGADPLCMNFEGWKPEMFSLTVQAEVYYRNLVGEFEKRNAEEQRLLLDRKGKGGGAVRLVAQDDDDEDDEDEGEHEGDDSGSYVGRTRADSGKSTSTFESAMT